MVEGGQGATILAYSVYTYKLLAAARRGFVGAGGRRVREKEIKNLHRRRRKLWLGEGGEVIF